MSFQWSGQDVNMATIKVSSVSTCAEVTGEVGGALDSELDLAGGESLLLHGYGAVAAQHSD